MKSRVPTLIGLLVAGWCVMTFTHEAGHLLGGWCCGGTLRDADLWPWSLPYSLFDPNPYPLVTLWCGPIFGVAVPVLLAWVTNQKKNRFGRAAWFVAYFCILANGAYLATAWYSVDPYLDTTKLLEHGTHPALIAIYCCLTIGYGYVGFRRECVRILSSSQEQTQDKIDHEADRANLAGPDRH